MHKCIHVRNAIIEIVNMNRCLLVSFNNKFINKQLQIQYPSSAMLHSHTSKHFAQARIIAN